MLQIINVDKSFGKVKALNQFSVTINTGELFGFVGPNGAGKTTMLKILAGLLKPDSGSVQWNKEDSLKAGNHKSSSIAYLPDYFGVYENLKVIEYMEFFSELYQVEPDKMKVRANLLLDQVGLSGKGNVYVDKLSKGMKQKLGLARCMIHNPELILLDEPFTGLDAIARSEFMRLLKQIQSMNKTILISSHMLPELERVCSSIGIMDQGRIMLQGTMDEIMKQKRMSNPIMIKVQDQAEKAVSILHQNNEISSIIKQQNVISITFHGNEEQEAQVLAELIQNGVLVNSFYREESDLETLFLRIAGERKGEE